MARTLQCCARTSIRFYRWRGRAIAADDFAALGSLPAARTSCGLNHPLNAHSPGNNRVAAERCFAAELSQSCAITGISFSSMGRTVAGDDFTSLGFSPARNWADQSLVNILEL